MDKLIPNYSITEYLSDDSNALATFTQSFYDVMKEAIENKSVYALNELLTSINDRHERVSNLLNTEDVANRKLYYFGYISALSTLGRDINRVNAEELQLEKLINSYPLLLPVLTVINQYDTVSGMKLKEELQQKSSNISNFMHRIKPYKLIETNKMGTVNYYSLTNKGKRLLNQVAQRDVEFATNKADAEKLIILVLEDIATQLNSETPSAVPVLRRIADNLPEIKEKQLLKYKLETVFLSRGISKQKLFSSCYEASRNDIEFEEYQNWDDHYLNLDELDSSYLLESSYV